MLTIPTHVRCLEILAARRGQPIYTDQLAALLDAQLRGREPTRPNKKLLEEVKQVVTKLNDASMIVMRYRSGDAWSTVEIAMNGFLLLEQLRFLLNPEPQVLTTVEDF